MLYQLSYTTIKMVLRERLELSRPSRSSDFKSGAFAEFRHPSIYKIYKVENVQPRFLHIYIISIPKRRLYNSQNTVFHQLTILFNFLLSCFITQPKETIFTWQYVIFYHAFRYFTLVIYTTTN